jgi:DNA modification methylase
MAINRLMLGDNLEILKTPEAESAGLICLDPPLFSSRNCLCGQRAGGGARRSTRLRRNGDFDEFTGERLNSPALAHARAGFLSD